MRIESLGWTPVKGSQWLGSDEHLLTTDGLAGDRLWSPVLTDVDVVERELDRCLVVNHDPVTGEHDEDLLHRLRPGVLLGHGARVQSGGRLRTGGPAGLWQG